MAEHPLTYAEIPTTALSQEVTGMAILTESSPNPEWHEELLTISLLGKGSLSRNEIKSRLRRLQLNHPDPEFRGTYHSENNYNKWIRHLKKRGVVQESDNELSLTKLGKWLSSSSLGDLFRRNSFLNIFVCRKCSSQPDIVLRSPSLDTIDVNRINVKGEVFIDLKCPRCGTTYSQVHLWPKDELVDFYNRAVQELQQFVKLEAQKISDSK